MNIARGTLFVVPVYLGPLNLDSRTQYEIVTQKSLHESEAKSNVRLLHKARMQRNLVLRAQFVIESLDN